MSQETPEALNQEMPATMWVAIFTDTEPMSRKPFWRSFIVGEYRTLGDLRRRLKEEGVLSKGKDYMFRVKYDCFNDYIARSSIPIESLGLCPDTLIELLPGCAPGAIPVAQGGME
ncbi:MAG: hypothetical protein ACYCOU_07035 [Sulfobacillus sp.]